MDNAVQRIRLSAIGQDYPMVTSLLAIFQEFLEERPTTETLAGSTNNVDYAPWEATRRIRDWYNKFLKDGRKYLRDKETSKILFSTLWEILLAISREIPYNSDKQYEDYHSWFTMEPKDMKRNNDKIKILLEILGGFEGLCLYGSAVKEFRDFPCMGRVAQEMFEGKWRGT